MYFYELSAPLISQGFYCVSDFDPLVEVANAAADVYFCWIGCPREWIAHGYRSAENLSCVSGFDFLVGITDSAADVNVYMRAGNNKFIVTRIGVLMLYLNL